MLGKRNSLLIIIFILNIQQIATLEIKLMNEKERADHADSRYKLLQSQNSQIEKVIPDIFCIS